MKIKIYERDGQFSCTWGQKDLIKYSNGEEILLSPINKLFLKIEKFMFNTVLILDSSICFHYRLYTFHFSSGCRKFSAEDSFSVDIPWLV